MHLHHFVTATCALSVLILAACGGGGSVTGVPADQNGNAGAANGGSGNNGSQVSDDETLSDKFARYRVSDNQSYTWPEVGQYTHHLLHLLGKSVGDGLYEVAPFNVRCQEESCWMSEEALTTTGTIESAGHVMEHQGISIFGAQGTSNIYSRVELYGAWLDFSAFFVRRNCSVGVDCELAGGFVGSDNGVVGQPSGSNPSWGSASWSGVVTASDTETHNLIFGDSQISIGDLSAPHVDVSLTNLWDVTDDIKRDDISWHDIPLSGGMFGIGYAPIATIGPGGDFIVGQFYGDAHEEVAGRFEHPSSQTRGAFGGKRTD